MRIRLFSDYIESLTAIAQSAEGANIEHLLERINHARQAGHRIMICGNGGSAATASHFAADLAKNTKAGNKRPFHIVCLNDNVSAITAYANDLHYADIYAQQVDNFGRLGDVLIAISGSGNSANILAAIDRANEAGIFTVALVGFDGGQAAERADLVIHAPGYDYEIVEDIHSMVLHYIVMRIKNG